MDWRLGEQRRLLNFFFSGVKIISDKILSQLACMYTCGELVGKPTIELSHVNFESKRAFNVISEDRSRQVRRDSVDVYKVLK